MLLFLLALPFAVYAQGGGGTGQPVREVTDDEVNALSRQLYCPVCENVPLDVCPTEACARWRAQVRTLLEQGATDEEVVNYFVTQFGQGVVGVPQDPGLNFLSWAVPLGAFVLGLGVVAYVLVRWRRRDSAPAASDVPQASGPGNSEDYRARLERELRSQE